VSAIKPERKPNPLRIPPATITKLTTANPTHTYPPSTVQKTPVKPPATKSEETSEAFKLRAFMVLYNVAPNQNASHDIVFAYMNPPWGGHPVSIPYPTLSSANLTVNKKSQVMPWSQPGRLNFALVQ